MKEIRTQREAGFIRNLKSFRTGKVFALLRHQSESQRRTNREETEAGNEEEEGERTNLSGEAGDGGLNEQVRHQRQRRHRVHGEGRRRRHCHRSRRRRNFEQGESNPREKKNENRKKEAACVYFFLEK